MTSSAPSSPLMMAPSCALRTSASSAPSKSSTTSPPLPTGSARSPLTPAFTEDMLATVVEGRQAPLKSVLLDQRRVAGLGNIYVDESLFLAGLHPSVPAGSLRAEECARLHAAIEQTLREGIAHRGASFRDYTDADGKDGNQQHFVRVFRRTGQPCDCCGGTIQRTVVGGRASHWCPRCQPARQARRKPRRRIRKDARATARA